MIQLQPISLLKDVVDDSTSTNNHKQTKKFGAKAIYWQSIVDTWIASGLTKKLFCEQNNISFSALSYWRHRLSKKTNDPHKKKFSTQRNDKQNRKNTASKTALPFSQLKVTLPPEPLCLSSPLIEVMTPSNYTIKLPVSMDVVLLKNVLTVLEVCHAENF